MEQEFNRLDMAELRANTLANNLVWLRSFGCTITREGKLVRVHHAKLREFSACLVVDNDVENVSRLKDIFAGTESQTVPDIYIDSEVKDGSVFELLAGEGFKPILTSVVTAVAVLPGKESELIVLEPATLSTRALWCEVYAEGFARTGEITLEEVIDRWGETFLSKEVQSWFFVANGRPVGVCQICTANGVVGLYSFALLPSERGVGKVLSALRTLRAKLVRDGARIAYFERVQKFGPHRKVGIPSLSTVTIREFTAFRRLR